MKTCQRLLSLFLCLFLLASCAPAGPGPSNSPVTPGPANTASGGETQPTKTPNYLSDPKFDTADVLPRYDHDKSWGRRVGVTDSFVTNGTLYYVDNSNSRSLISYCDLATGISGPLCGKPECPHNDAQCNAYVPNYYFRLSLYDGKLYWTAFDEEKNPAIYCMNLDATDRVKVCSMDRSRHQKVHGNRILAFHRGYAIYAGRTSTVSQGIARQGVLAYAVSLSTGEETVLLEQECEEGFYAEIEIVPYRDRVYQIVEHGSVGPVEDDAGISFSIFEWSLKTHENVSLYSRTGDFPFREAWPTEDGLLLSSAVNGDIYKFDFATHEFAFLFDFYDGEDQHGGMEFSNDYIINWTLTEEGIPRLRVTDLEGGVVYDGELDLPDWPTQGFGYALMGADDENVYLRLESLRKEKPLKEWFVKTIVQIPLDGGGAVRELWSVERELG